MAAPIQIRRYAAGFKMTFMLLSNKTTAQSNYGVEWAP